MPMKNPPHPGLGLRDDIEALGWPTAKAAEALGISRQKLQSVITGKSAITPELAIRLERGIGTGAETWLRMQSAYDLVEARVRAADIKVRKLTPRVA